MNSLTQRAALLLLLFEASPQWTQAVPAFAHSDLSFHHVNISPASGTLVLLGPWHADAFADVDGAAFFDSTADGTTSAIASSTNGFADAFASADPLALGGTATATGDIPDGVAAFYSVLGRGSLYNTFMITGGAGSVPVTFSVELSGSLAVETGDLGLNAAADAVFTLGIDGTPALFSTESLSIGPSSFQQLAIATIVSSSQDLLFETPYFISLEADAEARTSSRVADTTGRWSDISIIALMLIGVRTLRKKPTKVRFAAC